jgi:hypothetical protein
VWRCSDEASNDPVGQQKSTCWLTLRISMASFASIRLRPSRLGELPDIGQCGTNTVFWRHKADLCEFLEHVVEQSVLLLSQACGLASQPTWIIAIAPNAAHVYTIPSEPTGHRHRRHRYCRHPIDPKLLGQDESLLVSQKSATIFGQGTIPKPSTPHIGREVALVARTVAFVYI